MGIKVTLEKNPYIAEICPTFFRFFRKDIGHRTFIDITYVLHLYFIRWAIFISYISKTWDMGHIHLRKKHRIKLDISPLYRDFFLLYNVSLILMERCPT